MSYPRNFIRARNPHNSCQFLKIGMCLLYVSHSFLVLIGVFSVVTVFLVYQWLCVLGMNRTDHMPSLS